MEWAEGNDFNSISSSRNLGHGIYKTVLEEFIAWDFCICSNRGGCHSLSPVHPAFAQLCVVQVLPSCFSCCLLGRTALALTGRVLYIQPDQWAWGRHSACTTLTSLSQRVVQDHLASGLPACLSKMQISGSCPGLQDLNPWGQWPESTVWTHVLCRLLCMHTHIWETVSQWAPRSMVCSIKEVMQSLL